MSDKAIFENKIEVTQKHYCIMNDSGKVIDADNNVCGDFTYDSIRLPLDEENDFVNRKELVTSPNVDKQSLYLEEDLPKLKEILYKLRENFSDESFEIIEFSTKTYQYTTFNILNE